jgi:hypothetical protein
MTTIEHAAGLELARKVCAVENQRDELLTALKALADRADATSECDHKRISCEDIGCIGAEVRRARVAIARAEAN